MKRVVFLVGVCLAASAQAQVFRCQGASGKVEYSDTPCAATAKRSEAMAIMPAQEPTYQQAPSSQGNAYGGQLDAAIAGALADRDYRKAKQLAVTASQFDRIREAEMAEQQVKAAQADKQRARRVEVSKMIQQQSQHDEKMRSLRQIENNTASWNRPIQSPPNYRCQRSATAIEPGELDCRPSPY